MAKLYFRHGAMGSSKTANALMVAYNYQEKGQRALLLKPALDDRDGTNTMRSRIGLEQECLPVEALMDMDEAELRGHRLRRERLLQQLRHGRRRARLLRDHVRETYVPNALDHAPREPGEQRQQYQNRLFHLPQI